MKLESANGFPYGLHIDSKLRARTHSVTRTEDKDHAVDGEAFTFGTKAVNVTGASENALFFIRNNDDRAVHITALIWNIGTIQGSGSLTKQSELRLLRNPTSGTIIDDAIAAPLNANDDLGAAKPFSNVQVYVGAVGKTLVADPSESDQAFFTMNGPGRLPAPTGWIIRTGNRLGFMLNPNLASGNYDTYITVVGFLLAEADE